MMKDTYIFSSRQLKTLLIGKGYKKIVGLNLKTDELGYNQSARALNKLVKTGAVYTEDETFLMSEDVREIITVLGNAEKFDVIRTKKDNLADICCYRAHKLMMVRNIQANKDWYSFSFLSLEDFYELLLDDGYLPDDNVDDLFYDDELEEFENPIVFDPLSAIGETVPVLFSLDISVNTDCHKYMRIMDYYFFRYIVVSDGEGEKRYAYSRKKFKEVFLPLMER